MIHPDLILRIASKFVTPDDIMTAGISKYRNVFVTYEDQAIVIADGLKIREFNSTDRCINCYYEEYDRLYLSGKQHKIISKKLCKNENYDALMAQMELTIMQIKQMNNQSKQQNGSYYEEYKKILNGSF